MNKGFGLGTFEDFLYARLVKAEGLGERKIRKEHFNINSTYYVELTINSKDGRCLSHYRLTDSTIFFSLQFGEGNKTLLRIDNSRGFLHSHNEIENHKKIDCFRPISQTISSAFEDGKKRLKEKLGHLAVLDGEDFIGAV